MSSPCPADAGGSEDGAFKLARSMQDAAHYIDQTKQTLQVHTSEVDAAARVAVPPKLGDVTSFVRKSQVGDDRSDDDDADRAIESRVEELRPAAGTVGDPSIQQTCIGEDDVVYDVSVETELADTDVVTNAVPGAGCMIVDGVLDGHPCRVLLDSGASHSHVSDQFVSTHALKASRLTQWANGLMANGSEQRIDRIVRRAELCLSELAEHVDLLVMPMYNYDVILGMNWHRAHKPVTYHDTSIDYFANQQKRSVTQSGAAMKHMSSCMISSTQLRRMLRKAGTRHQPKPLEMYLAFAVATDPQSIVVKGLSATDSHQQRFMQRYPDVCSDKLDGLPPKRSFDHRIALEEGAVPPNRQAYRESAALNDELKRQLTELLQAQVIRPSQSPFASPVLFVKKHDGTWRMCIDYRALNRVTKKNRYPLPHQDDLIERLRHAKCLTKLDLASGYWQVRMSDDSVEKTAFTTRHGLFEWLVMPFGLCNAPSTFMQMMNDVLAPLIDRCVIVFLDDILIYSPTAEQHEQDVTAVFELLRKHKLRVKLSKCDFFKEEVEFLGHVVGKGNVRMCPGKVAAITEWPTPRNTHDVRSFLGLSGYYRKFVRDYSKVATPLYALTQADTQFVWSDEAQQSLDALKAAITSAPVLALPDHNKPWIMFTDASGYAIGGVLCQDHGSGPQPVLFVSHKLGGAELNWPVHDKEMYAIIYMFKTCRWYVQDRHVTVYTDHRALQHFESQPTLSPRQTRWQQYLASYDWTIVYKAGKYNVVADGLSRRSDLQIEVSSVGISELRPDSEWLQHVQQGYLDDAWCKAIIDAKGTAIYTVVSDDRGTFIYRGEQLVIPAFDAAKQLLLSEAHDALAAGHRGAFATHHRLSRHYFWPKMYEEIVTYCKQCSICQQSKNVTLKPAGQLQPLPVPGHIGDSISIDFVIKLPRTEFGHTGFLTIVDRLSKYVVLVPIRTKSDNSSALAHNSQELDVSGDIPAAEYTFQLLFDNWVKHFGVPQSIVSDRDTQFMSKFWQAAHSAWGTRLSPTTAYHPEGDGQTERTHRTVEEVLRTLTVNEQDRWDRWLTHATVAINTSPSATTRQTPHFAVFGREMRTPLTTLTEQHAVAPNATAMVQSYTDRINQLREAMLQAQRKQKLYADHKRRAERFNVGDYVYVTTQHLRAPDDRSSKLKYKWAGPYCITREVNEVTFELDLHPRKPAHQSHSTFHVSKLRRFYPRLHRFIDDRVDDVPYLPDVDDDGDEEYEVEQVLDKKRFGTRTGNIVKYLIRWKGYSRYHDTWEPLSHLHNARDLINEFDSVQSRGLNKHQMFQQVDDLVSDVSESRLPEPEDVMPTPDACVEPQPITYGQARRKKQRRLATDAPMTVNACMVLPLHHCI